MKKFLLLFITVFVGCKNLTTEELAEEVKQSMIETFAEKDDWINAKIVDFNLVHKSGNEYKGVVDLIVKNPITDLLNNLNEKDNSKGIEISYPVEVIYDGTNFSWQIITK